MRPGMVGGGQLARMTYQAGIPLGLSLRVLAERRDDSAALVAADVELGAPNDFDALVRFAGNCDVVTFDHELVPPELLTDLEQRGHVLRPGAVAKRFAQDKWHQRTTLQAMGFPVPPHAPVTSASDVVRFAEVYGWPVVLKASRGGYDGRGVWMLKDAGEAGIAVTEAGDLPLYVEAHVPIERELAVMVARRPSGEMVVYPVVETVQVDGMCREVVVPAHLRPHEAKRAAELAGTLADAIGVVGVVALELFEVRGDLLVNELACRPHNSGHYSIEGCVTSQFENHLRAILDWPLGDTGLTAPAAVTVNVVGAAGPREPAGAIGEALAVPGVHVHLYGKATRPGRKLGHVTALGQDVAEARGRALRAADAIGAPTPRRPGR